MAFRGSLLLGLLVFGCCLSWMELSAAQSVQPSNIGASFNRTSFPSSFIFGASSAAYQYEGAAFEDGKGPSIWDTFTRQYPGKITDHSNSDVGNDFYHRYKEDIQLMKFIGIDAFRLSISWPRVLPDGKLSKGVNQKGIDFYNNVINELLANGIKPFVTLFHFDTPQALEDEYGGFLSPQIVKDFVDFAELCFKEFGDRVKHWATSNEGYTFATGGYEHGSMAPGRCSAWLNNGCPAGDSGREPYVVGHNLILCHAQAAKLYREKYKPIQKGYIGIVLNPDWFVPYSSRKADVDAAQRALDFMYGWFIEPLTYGDYPTSMKTLVGDRLPKFTPEQSALVKGSLDYLGINYYTSNYAAYANYSNNVNVSYTTDSQTNQTTERNGHYIGAPTGVSIFYVYPRGLREILLYTKYKYNNPVIYILECGMGDANINTVEAGINDTMRVHFYHRHLLAVKSAIDNGVRVKGFFAWTFMDTWEWSSGFTQRFGVNFVDYNDGLKRYPKKSGLWFKKFLLKN